MTERHFYEPRNGHGLPHCPLNAIVAPRPIGWVTTISGDGCVNLAPYSHFNIFNDEPPILVFGSGREKDSVRNIRQTGEFVWNLATLPLAQQMNISSADFPYGTDEMAVTGLQAERSHLVRPPRVAASPAAFECKLIELTRMKDAAGRELPSFIVFGEVVGIHIDRAYLRNGLFDTAAAQPLARCGYRGEYAAVTSLFQMFRPASAAEAVALANDARGAVDGGSPLATGGGRALATS
jgi:flavin reductase (DIM6/NTAB) family NADH-FMN oxidoreductase RutF